MKKVRFSKVTTEMICDSNSIYDRTPIEVEPLSIIEKFNLIKIKMDTEKNKQENVYLEKSNVIEKEMTIPIKG